MHFGMVCYERVRCYKRCCYCLCGSSHRATIYRMRSSHDGHMTCQGSGISPPVVFYFPGCHGRHAVWARPCHRRGHAGLSVPEDGLRSLETSGLRSLSSPPGHAEQLPPPLPGTRWPFCLSPSKSFIFLYSSSRLPANFFHINSSNKT